jgi:hypothetical protein
MALPDSYTPKTGALQDYFDALLNAQPPERFSQKFMERLDFKSTNDRLFIGILKDLGFLDTDGIPTDRYYRFLDRTQWQRVLAEGISEAYADLFAVNTRANELTADEATNKLRTLYAGTKSDNVIARIARTFTALCELGDFTPAGTSEIIVDESTKTVATPTALPAAAQAVSTSATREAAATPSQPLSISGLQYHINIVLPESRDQGVYDAIFKSLRDHLGR